jgi:hypothetical protein
MLVDLDWTAELVPLLLLAREGSEVARRRAVEV